MTRQARLDALGTLDHVIGRRKTYGRRRLFMVNNLKLKLIR
jgi:hypothetical protein